MYGGEGGGGQVNAEKPGSGLEMNQRKGCGLGSGGESRQMKGGKQQLTIKSKPIRNNNKNQAGPWVEK